MASLKTETMLVRVHNPIIVKAVAEANTILGSTLIHLLVQVEANKTTGHMHVHSRPPFASTGRGQQDSWTHTQPPLLLTAHHPKPVGEGAGST